MLTNASKKNGQELSYFSPRWERVVLELARETYKLEMTDFDESDENCGLAQMFELSDQLEESASHIEEHHAEIPAEIPEEENYGEISFTMKFDLEATSKSGENRLLINVAECRHIPRHPLVSHPYVKGQVIFSLVLFNFKI